MILNSSLALILFAAGCGGDSVLLEYNPERQLVVRAVVFADRGWEGQPEAAAEMLASQQGSDDTRVRIARRTDRYEATAVAENGCE